VARAVSAFRLADLLGFGRSAQVRTLTTLMIVGLGPVLAVLTFLVLRPLNFGTGSGLLRGILLVDLLYVMLVAGLVAGRVWALLVARRRQSTGARLHLRLAALFAAIALGPAILVAAFAAITINVGVEGWFSERVRNVIGASLRAAQAYQEQQSRDLDTDTRALAEFIDRARAPGQAVPLPDGDMRLLLQQGQRQIQRGLREAFVIDGTGEIRARGERSYLFDFERPEPERIRRAADGQIVQIDDWPNNELRALIRLGAHPDRLLYVSRSVDGALLGLLDETMQTARLYNQLEAERGRILFEFAIIYLGFAVILLLAAVWLGLWFAERLAQPVAELARAAERVGEGDLDARVDESSDKDEIAMLGGMFNRMTYQLRAQRDALVASHRDSDAQRRLIDSVLSSVTAGVIGLDAYGRAAFANPSALRLLDLGPADARGRPLAALVPEFAPLFDRLRSGIADSVQDEIRLTRARKAESLLVRMATRHGAAGDDEGYVVVFDDVTELVSAQRVAAWGDVARRIAHEIKNPLTPIQLSAERIRRKFGPALAPEAADQLAQLIDVIVRQTSDLRRIVDEFSRFARMPEADRKGADLVRLVRDAVLLQESAQPGVRFVCDLPDLPVMAEIDTTLMSQALTNLLKNAGEAIETRTRELGPDGWRPEIRIGLLAAPGLAEVTICDNGIGLPEDRARLFEPYVTLRAGGTGLGLPIVRKIIEEHGGTLALTDAPPFQAGASHRGAMALIRLPLGPRGAPASVPASAPDPAPAPPSEPDESADGRHPDR
jgi:two-component system nitrogen regulation sensor histidine kinase NtrY